MNNLTSKNESYLKKSDSDMKKFFLRFGSATEDNIESMNRIELSPDLRIKIKNKELCISDIVNALEDMEEAPQEIKEYYPNITDQEWQASTRLSTLTFLVFEKSLKEHILKSLKRKIEAPDYKNETTINNRLPFSSNRK